MISFLIEYKRSILIITLLFFIGSIGYLGLGAYNRSQMTDAAATVGGKKISYRQLYRLVDERARQVRNQGIDVDEDTLKILQQQYLAALIGEEILNQAGKKADLYVSDYEVAYDIQTAPVFADANGRFNKKQYVAFLKRDQRLQPAEFEARWRHSKLANRFRTVLYSFYKMTPAEVEHNYRVQHGNLKDYEKNKKEFANQLMDTKMSTAQQGFFDEFNAHTRITNNLKD